MYRAAHAAMCGCRTCDDGLGWPRPESNPWPEPTYDEGLHTPNICPFKDVAVDNGIAPPYCNRCLVVA